MEKVFALRRSKKKNDHKKEPENENETEEEKEKEKETGDTGSDQKGTEDKSLRRRRAIVARSTVIKNIAKAAQEGLAKEKENENEHEDSSSIESDRDAVRILKDRNSTTVYRKWAIDFTELELGEEIGRGAFGVVHLGRWRKSKVVIKNLWTNRMKPQEIDNFTREAEIIMNLRPHDNLVKLLGICVEPQRLSIVLEYVPLGDLQNLFKRERLSPRTKLKLALDCAAAMYHLHLQRVLHCDLACRNILVECTNNEYRAKVTDFGLAKKGGTIAGHQGKANATFGPIKWMSPERLTTNKATKKSDVWSFGIVLWELLTERSPYAELSLKEAGQAIVAGKLLEIPSYCPAAIDDMMYDCWQLDPLARPDFEEIYDRLENFIESGEECKEWANADLTRIAEDLLGHSHGEGRDSAADDKKDKEEEENDDVDDLSDITPNHSRNQVKVEYTSLNHVLNDETDKIT